MGIITYEKIKISGLPFLTGVTDLKISCIPNRHGELTVIGYGEPDDFMKGIEENFSGRTLEVRSLPEADGAGNTIIFSGIITECSVSSDHQGSLATVKAMTGSSLLDVEKKSRSFQNPSMTYQDIVDTVLKDHGGQAICSVGMDIPINSPLIQYQETDWAFICRLASHFNSPVIPDTTSSKANLWFGINQNGADCIFEDTYYHAGFSAKYYEEDAASAGYAPTDFLYFKVKDKGNYNIGDHAQIKGINLKICEKYAELKDSVLEFTYLVGGQGLIVVKTSYNDAIIGLSLKGTVAKTEKETVYIKLDIDGAGGKAEYPYNWAPSSGNMMYCMPKAGTQVSLLLADHDERNAKAVNSPRGNGGSCPDMSDYNKRAFATEHNKKMLLFPESISAVGTSNTSVPLHMTLDDLNYIHFQSHKEIQIIAQSGIRMNAPSLSLSSPISIPVVRTPEAAGFQSAIMPVGSGLSGIPPAVTVPATFGGSPTFLVLQSQFDVQGNHGVFYAYAYVTYAPFDDAPQKGVFNIWDSIFKALVCIAVVVVVAVVIVATGGSAAVAVGAVIGATMAAGALVVSDIESGNNSSWNTYFRKTFTGAIAGAISNPVVGAFVSTGFEFAWSQLDGTKDVGIEDFIFNMATSWVSGKLTQGLGSIAGKLGNKFSGNKLGTVFKKLNKLLGGCDDPVDAVSGTVFYDLLDFEYPGVIPLEWERSWSSRNTGTGAFGYGSAFLYAMYIKCDDEKIILDGNGSEVSFDYLKPGEQITDRKARMTLSYDGTFYEAFDHETRLYYVFADQLENIFKLTRIENETREHRITLKYDKRCRLSAIEDTVGRSFRITGNETGQITKVTYDGKILMEYAYDDQLNLVGTTNVNGSHSTIYYEDHLMVKRITMGGTAFHWEYDGEGENARCIHTWGDGGLLEGRFAYHEGYTVHTDSLDRKKVFIYDEESNLTAVISENGSETAYAYNEYGEISSVTNGDGEKTTYSYNDFGQITSIALPNGGTQISEYDGQGKLIKSITQLSGVSTWEYDEIGRISRTTLPNGAPTVFEYNDRGMVAAFITGDKGNECRTGIEYDDYLNPVRLMFPNGAREEWEYDKDGNCIKSINPLGAVRTMAYDRGNRLIRYIDADGNETQLTYNAYNDVVRMKNKEGEIGFTYTPFGHLKSRTEQNRHIVMHYDTEEQLVRVENEAGEKYTFEMDCLGNTIFETGYDGVRKSYSYTAAGKLKGMKRGNTAGWTYMAYDKGGNLSKISYENGEEELFTYGKMGELLSAENKNGKFTFEYDSMGNIIKETQNGYVVESSYSSVYGARTSVKTSLGLQVDISRNKYGQAEEINANFQGISEWNSRRSFNTIGQVVEHTLNGSVKDAWNYDNQGRPLSHRIRINERESSHRQYRWAAGYRLQSIIDNISNMGVEYSYDRFGNPESEKCKGMKLPPGQTSSIRYLDESGNVYETRSKIDRKYGAGGQLLTRKGCRYRYNDCGDLVEKTEPDGKIWHYMYHPGGLLERVLRPDGKEVSFTYDPLGRRISKNTESKSIKFLWDGDNIIHEWDDRKETSEVSAWLYEEDEFTPLAKLTKEKSYSIISNHLGTPNEMLNENGESVWKADLDLYGKMRLNEVGSTTGEDCLFRFPGQYEDEETGLYYNRFRYYMPDEGMYTQRDPIGLAGGNSTIYGYVWNTLVQLDPFGLNRITGKGRTHVTYHGLKYGLPYSGYASAPSKLRLTPEQIVARRYGGNFEMFGGNAPEVIYSGEDEIGKNIARGLEHRTYEADLEKANLKKVKIANKQKPVGYNNPRKNDYFIAADNYLDNNKMSVGCKS